MSDYLKDYLDYPKDYLFLSFPCADDLTDKTI